ncbi:UNVERIFIED_CONTAM: hypothetical protein FKN15_039298 [Acipenser sinensis]
MSISRKNWSALSSLTRQWTVEDEEEVERERRRRIRSTSTTSEPPDSSSNEPGEQKPHSAQDKEKPEEADPENLAFLEMLKTRDERRKKRHLETLMRQKEGVEECQPSTPESEREGQGGRVEAEGEGQRGRVVIESKAQREGQGGRVAIESKAQREGQGGRLDTEAQKDSMGGVQWELRNSTGRGKSRQETTLDGESTPAFQRNSKLRISSRTIEEKLERLAMAAQKSEQVKSPTASRKDCFLFADEVARKRGVFEREATSVERNSATSRKDLRKVDISSKRNLWENRSESSSASPSKR